MSHKNFEHMDKTENMENVEKTDKPEGKENILGKIKDFFDSHGKGKEGGEDRERKESKEESMDKKGGEDKEKEEKKNFFDQYKVDGKADEVAKAYREKHGLDEHGEKIDKKSGNTESGEDDMSAHGEGGERTRYSDAKAEQKAKTREEDDLER